MHSYTMILYTKKTARKHTTLNMYVKRVKVQRAGDHRRAVYCSSWFDHIFTQIGGDHIVRPNKSHEIKISPVHVIAAHYTAHLISAHYT